MIRCAHCKKRIRENHPHVSLKDYDSAKELAYHARTACSKRALQAVLGATEERGGVFGLSHHHVCGDEASGFDCWAGCFREVELN
jgi:hypothetical protein